MRVQEKEHAHYFEKEMRERRVRPSLLLPLWDVAGFTLGKANKSVCAVT